MKSKRLPPSDRRAQLMAAALALAERHDYRSLKRADIAERAGVSAGLVTQHLGTMDNMRRDLMRAAIKHRCLAVIAQGLAAKDRYALKAPAEIRQAAALALGGVA